MFLKDDTIRFFQFNIESQLQQYFKTDLISFLTIIPQCNEMGKNSKYKYFDLTRIILSHEGSGFMKYSYWQKSFDKGLFTF